MDQEDKRESPTERSGDPILTLHLRRTHVIGLILFLAGVLVGLLAYWVLDEPDYVTLGSEGAEQLFGAQSVAPAPAPTAGAPVGATVDVDVEGRPSFGPDDAPVTIVEFLDYQCPFCERHFQEVLPTLRDRYGDEVKYVVRNFPLPAIHPLATDAAVAAECAFEQDSFVEYHDRLFEQQASLKANSFVRLAEQLDLDIDAFRSCVDDPGTLETVNADATDGRSYGVTGTPTFFINGRLLAGAQPFETFQQMIDEELKKEEGG